MPFETDSKYRFSDRPVHNDDSMVSVILIGCSAIVLLNVPKIDCEYSIPYNNKTNISASSFTIASEYSTIHGYRSVTSVHHNTW